MLIAAGFAGLLCAGIANATVVATTGSEPGPVAAEGVGSVEEIARLIFIDYLWAFELTAALLITATPVRWFSRTGNGSSPSELSAKCPSSGSGAAATPPAAQSRCVRPAQCRRHPARLPNGSLSELSVPGHVITKQIQTDSAGSARAGAGQAVMNPENYLYLSVILSIGAAGGWCAATRSSYSCAWS